jgi:hypothetical protein
MDLDSESESNKRDDDDDNDDESEAAEATKESEAVTMGIVVDAWTEGVKLPAEPTGLCSASLQVPYFANLRLGNKSAHFLYF